MKSFVLLIASTVGLFAQAHENMARFQPNFDDLKAALGLTDDQITKLREMQQEKMAATQAFYTKMADKQKELNQLMESGSSDAARIGQIMLDLQQMRKQPAPGLGDVHEKAVATLTDDQKVKLEKLEEAQKLRSAVDQATQLALLNMPAQARPVVGPGAVAPKAAKPAAQK